MSGVATNALAALNATLVTRVEGDVSDVSALPKAVFAHRLVEFELEARKEGAVDERDVYCVAASEDERMRLIAELDQLTSKCENSKTNHKSTNLLIQCVHSNILSNFKLFLFRLNAEADALTLAQDDAERKKQVRIRICAPNDYF